MTKTAYLIIAILVLFLLLTTFIVSFVLYRKTPLPKGCQDLKIDKDSCRNCGNNRCVFSKKEKENK